ncbi:MAG TPA: alpha/beta hydrolase, partial [Terriglobales bacterium]
PILLGSSFAEAKIETSLHPVRWAVALAVAVPLVVAVAFLFARLSGNAELARSSLRGLRIVIVAELALLIVAAVLGVNYEQRAQKHDAESLHPPGRLVDIGGFRLHLYCVGTGGPTVLLEHGHQSTYLDWYRVQPQLAKFTRVCSYDRAGYGWSDQSPNARVPSVMADELHKLLAAAGEKPPYILVGHSFGGYDALMFAHKFPAEVAGVVLVDSPHPDAFQPASRRSHLWLRVMQFTMPFGLPRWRGWCGGGPLETAAEKEVLNCRSTFYETIIRENRGMARAAVEMHSIKTLGDLPLVVIARDPAMGQDTQAEARHNEEEREFTKLSPNSRFIVAERSAHDIPLARPDVIVEAVRSLLKSQGQAGSRETP